MDDVTTYALAGAVVLLALVVAIATRRRRDRSLEPVRLGPSWTPPGSTGRPATDAAEVLRDDERVATMRERTGLDEETVATVLIAWDELLSVLGYRSLPSDHEFRVYDPYDPPIASRGSDGRPVADPVRVARDVDRRTRVAEIDARTVLDALLQDPGAVPDHLEREDATAASPRGQRPGSLTEDTPGPARHDATVDAADPSVPDPDTDVFGEPTGIEPGRGDGRGSGRPT